MNATWYTLEGPHAALRVQALGAMLGPVTLRLSDGRTVSPMYQAPWHGETGPGLNENPLLRHLNGEWLCAPYGPAAAPPDLPVGWRARELPGAAGDRGWDHGWVANHHWSLAAQETTSLLLELRPPADHALERVERLVRLMPDAPGIDIVTTLHPRRTVTWPVALHPTFALPLDGVELVSGPCRAVHAYPLAPVRGVSRLQPGGRASTLAALPANDGTTLDLRRLPLPGDTEELLQLEDVLPPFTLRLQPDGAGATGGVRPVELDLDWDAALLPDLLLWVSQGGRVHAPWNGRNLALGVEPCASAFDLTRVAESAPDHPLAHRRGLTLRAGEPIALRWSLRARAVAPDDE